jgi:hypothetical protein
MWLNNTIETVALASEKTNHPFSYKLSTKDVALLRLLYRDIYNRAIFQV